MSENNILIAQFMGAKIVGSFFTVTTWDIPNSPGYHHVLYYNSSWDWLIPVVEKIEALGFRTEIHTLSTLIFDGDRIINEIYGYTADISKIEHIYKAVVDFINWWNNK